MKGRSKRREENGVFLILFAILFLTIFSFVAIAVDTANITIAKIRLYNAIDNAIMVAPIFYLGKKYDETEIKARLNAVTRANYEADATDSANVLDITLTVNKADVQIDSKIKTRLWLSPAAFGSGSTAEISGKTKLRIPRVNLAIVLDVSASMDHPDPNNPGQTKLFTALGGLKVLTTWLRDDFDRVAIIITSDYAHRVFDFTPTGGYDAANIEATLLGLQANLKGGWTNLSAGLYEARINYTSINWPPDDYNVTGIMSDGYLSHGRANFDPTGNPGLDPNTTSFGQLDYHFQLESTVCRDGCGTAAGIYSPARYTLRMNPLVGNPPWFTQSPACQTITQIDVEPTYGPRYDSTLSPSCLGFAKIIGGDGETIDLGALNGAKDGFDGDKFRELAYYATIAQTDALRFGGSHVLSLGIGAVRPAPTNRTATIGNPTTVFSSMGPVAQSGIFGETFFRRLAMSPKGMGDVAFPKVPSIPEMFANPDLAKVAGEYYEASALYSREEGLRLLFGQMEFKKEF